MHSTVLTRECKYPRRGRTNCGKSENVCASAATVADADAGDPSADRGLKRQQKDLTLVLHRSVEAAATNRPPAARNRLPLVTQLRTFRDPRWTSGFDPKAT